MSKTTAKPILPLRARMHHPIFRYPALTVAHSLIIPAQWLLHQTPLAQPAYNLLLGQLELTRNKGKSFGAYQPNAQDVVVCSYGKSGTNWSMQITHQIAQQGEGNFDHIHNVVPWPDAPVRSYAVALEDPAPYENSPTGIRVIKTHLPRSCVPYTSEGRYVCVVRDPKDVIVSAYHFFKAVFLGPIMPPVTVWVEHFLTEKSFLGSWAQHLNGYWQERHLDNVLFLTFEEMKADLPGAVNRIAELMGVELSPDQYEKVLVQSSFAHMKSIDEKFYPGHVSPLGAPDGKMMREGKSGAAHSLLTPEQQFRVDQVCKTALQNMGCDFPYTDLYEKQPAIELQP